jgi:hypothetical protein
MAEGRITSRLYGTLPREGYERGFDDHRGDGFDYTLGGAHRRELRGNPSRRTLFYYCASVGQSAPAQSTEAKVGPYDLQDFNLYYITRYGFRPSKVAFLCQHAWSDKSRGTWLDHLAATNIANTIWQRWQAQFYMVLARAYLSGDWPETKFAWLILSGTATLCLSRRFNTKLCTSEVKGLLLVLQSEPTSFNRGRHFHFLHCWSLLCCTLGEDRIGLRGVVVERLIGEALVRVIASKACCF